VKAPTDGEYHNIYHLFSRGGLRMRPTAPCFGSRVRDDGSISTYQWQTYQEVDKRVGAFAAALVKLDLAPTTADGKRFLGFFLKNSRDWMVGALACYRIGVVVVPMYDTLGPETVSYIQGQTMMSTALCTAAELKLLTKQKTFPFANVLVSGALSKEVRAAAEAKGVRVFTVAELEALGQPNLGLLASVPEPKPADLAYLCYTSGTTGDPKGAMLSHGNLLAAIGNAGFPSQSIFAMDPNGPQEVHLSYLPLAHVFEPVVMNFCLYRGAAVGFYQGDTLKILEDLQALRPTLFVSVPRLYNRIHDKIIGGAKAKGGIAGYLFAKGLEAKLERLHSTGSVEHGLWDPLVFSKVRKQLGLDRCAKMLCGSAPIAANVKDFLRVAIGAVFIEGYGLTETSAAATIVHPEDISNFHVGMPVLCAELKLQDVSEMGYSSKNMPPSGEVCVRGPCVFGGYYKLPDKTAEAFDAEGWFHTGDIGAWTSTGCLRIVDRKKNIFKLAQGEYVAAEKIEMALLRCPLVAQMFVYGDSLQSCLVGICVPDADEVATWASANGLAGKKAADLLKSEATKKQLQAAVEAQIAAASKEAGLKGFEKIQALHLDAEAWSVDNGLLTPTFKMKRNDLKKHYQSVIDAMYAQIDAKPKVLATGSKL